MVISANQKPDSISNPPKGLSIGSLFNTFAKLPLDFTVRFDALYDSVLVESRINQIKCTMTISMPYW